MANTDCCSACVVLLLGSVHAKKPGFWWGWGLLQTERPHTPKTRDFPGFVLRRLGFVVTFLVLPRVTGHKAHTQTHTHTTTIVSTGLHNSLVPKKINKRTSKAPGLDPTFTNHKSVPEIPTFHPYTTLRSQATPLSLRCRHLSVHTRSTVLPGNHRSVAQRARRCCSHRCKLRRRAAAFVEGTTAQRVADWNTIAGL